MGGGVVGGDEGLVRLLECRGGGGQGELVIIEASLDVEMCLHQVLITLALGTLNRLVVDLQPSQHRLKGGSSPNGIKLSPKQSQNREVIEL
jgi:hypothetical protein